MVTSDDDFFDGCSGGLGLGLVQTLVASSFQCTSVYADRVRADCVASYTSIPFLISWFVDMHTLL